MDNLQHDFSTDYISSSDIVSIYALICKTDGK